eukprot:487483_1
MSLCEVTCAAIGRYYKYLNKDYEDLFSAYCEENGLEDDDSLQEEIENAANDCLLIDFDDDFPFKDQPSDDQARQTFIYNLIKSCIANSDIKFGSKIPLFTTVGAELFDLQKYNLNSINTLYKEQCPALYNEKWENDAGFLTILAVGRKYGFDYLLHLVDDYSRWCINNQDKDESTDQWAAQHPHFIQLRNITNTIGNRSVGYKELATCAVNSFGKRVCPPFVLKPMSKIDDDLETIVNYIVDAINWVWSLTTRANRDTETICPFQVDFCFVEGRPIESEVKEEWNPKANEEDDEPDGEDNTEEDEKGFVDVVGDIKERLDASELRYYKGERHHVDDPKQSRITDIYKEFVKKYDLEGSGNTAYLHKKRLITMIDRRESKKDVNKPDDIWMFEPPENCQNIANDTVPEWYINSSVTCLGPKSNTRESFGATSHCRRSTLTLSFHVKEERFVKCYLYWFGQMIRFMPEDIKTVLPDLFNPKRQSKRNKEEEKYLNELIKELKGKLVDEEFDAFVASYKY